MICLNLNLRPDLNLNRILTPDKVDIIYIKEVDIVPILQDEMTLQNPILPFVLLLIDHIRIGRLLIVEDRWRLGRLNRLTLSVRSDMPVGPFPMTIKC